MQTRMFNDTLLARLNKLLESQLSDRDRWFATEVTEINNDAIGHGYFHSGTRIHKLQEAYEHELGVRAQLIWQGLVRVHGILGSPLATTTREDFKREVASRVDQQADQLTTDCLGQVRRSHALMDVTLEDARVRIQNKHEVEIDLYVDSISFQASTTSVPMSTAYHFYGAVGAVMSGADATANVVQNLSQGDRADIENALMQVKQALATESNLTPQRKNELAAIADECATELKSPAPNNTKLLSMFNVLGLSIQSIASAQPAYQALKVALLSVGVSLP